MEAPAGGTGPNRSASKDDHSQKHAVDDESSSNSNRGDSVIHPKRLADVSASLRIFSESLLRKELTDLEMIKSREALKCETEKRKMELEIEMTRTMAQTQLQIASFVAGMNSGRKRKRAEEEQSRFSQREGALLLSMLQCNFII